ncbi:hypothetical protein V3481_017877 [Fusarium oxysporum f. sp. vasinfectum]
MCTKGKRELKMIRPTDGGQQQPQQTQQPQRGGGAAAAGAVAATFLRGAQRYDGSRYTQLLIGLERSAHYQRQ